MEVLKKWMKNKICVNWEFKLKIIVIKISSLKEIITNIKNNYCISKVKSKITLDKYNYCWMDLELKNNYTTKNKNKLIMMILFYSTFKISLKQ